jgi:site-specific recombinase XerD
MACLNFAKNIKKWRVRWRATNRKNHRIFSGSKVFFEKADALRFYVDIEQQERLWRRGESLPTESLQQAFEDFLRYCKRHTERTQQHYRFAIDRFAEGLPKDVTSVWQLKPNHILNYLGEMKDRGCKNRTCNSQLTAIKSFCRFNAERFDIGNPAAKIKMLKEDPPDVRFLSETEYEKLLDMAPPTARDRITFLAHTGLRASEFASLQTKNIELEASVITVIGKGRKRRTIPLNEPAREVLPRLKIGTRNALYLSFSRLARRAGIPEFGPHALRHYFATQLLLRGVPIVKVSLLLGHSSIRTTQESYSHILPADLLNVTDVLVEQPATQQNIVKFETQKKIAHFG